MFVVVLAPVLFGQSVWAHPEDEVCDPGQPPTPFCLALMGQLAVDEPPTAGEIITDYLKLGFIHILPRGLDHILFALALFLAAATWSSLIWQITTFTLAHSVTLALSVLGITAAGGPWIEVLIAASIAFVALENCVLQGRPVRFWRYGVVFGFGLLHGLGFAGVLLDLGLPSGQTTLALLAFNVGVEAGQLVVVGAALLLGWLVLRRWLGARRYVRWFTLPMSLLIALTGLVWAVKRWPPPVP